MKSKIFELVKSIVFASLFAFVLYFITAFTVAGFFEGDPNKHFYVSWWMLLLYYVSFYVIHERLRKETHADCFDQFTYRKEIMSYFVAEGKYLLAIYCILGIIVDISMVITNNAPQNPVGAVCAMFFPLMPYIPIPGVRSVLSVLLCMLGAVISVTIRSKRIKKKLAK